MLQHDEKKYTLPRLVWPIAVELYLFFLLGITDTLMMSRISDGAVAVSGLSNHFFEFVIVSFELICGGAGIMIAQNIGAKKMRSARRAATMAFALAFGIGLLLSVIIFFAASGIASILQMPVDFRDMGVTYIKIVGLSTFAISGMMALSAAIRNTGNTRGPMLVTLFINLLHIGLNYILIFGHFGFPRMELEGAAISTATTRIIGLLILFWMFRKAFGTRIRWKEFILFDRKLLRKISDVGLPMAGSAISWSLSQLVLVALVASMGTTMLATKTYMNMMEAFAYLGGWSLALAVQIQVGYLYGADLHERAYRSPFVAFRWGLLITMLNVVILLIVGRDVLQYLTDNPTIIQVGTILLWVNIILQPLKFTNMPLATAINAVGDSKYMFKINALSMWIISIGGTWFFGKSLEWMLFGVYLAMGLDELTRGIFVFRRWMSKAKLNID